MTIEPNGTGSHVRLTHTYPAAKDIRPFITMGSSFGLDDLGRI